MPLNTGFVLNSRYRIVKLLGQGGFGAVYRAWDISLNRPCAVKENMEMAEESQRQFSREASVLANLNHPNLPRVTDHFILPTGQYLVMDYIDGEDLACMVGRLGKLSWEQAWPWIEQVTRAVIYLHRHTPQIIHRDIKPANIRITPDGQAFLVDFGLVKYFDPNSRTTQGARAVTPGFSPPEQYGQGNTDTRTDIYALAATIYALLTGLEIPESVTRLVDDTIIPLRQANPGVPQHVETALRKAMQIRPGDRFASTEQFLQAMSGPIIQQATPGIPAQAMAVPAVTIPERQVQWQQPAPGMAAPQQQRGQAIPQAYPYPAPASTPAVKKRGFPWVGCLIGLVALVAIVALAFAGLYQLGAESLSKTAVVSSAIETQTAIAQAENQRMTATEDARVKEEAVLMTVTAAARAQEEARQRTATVAAVQSTAAALDAFTGSHTPVFGPQDGTLDMKDDNLVTDFSSGLSLTSFIVDVTFTNPYDTSEAGWDYGFLFRDQGGNNQYRLIINHDQKWALYNNVDNADGTIVNSGTAATLATGAGGSNRIMLISSGSLGWFYVNGKLISQLDLSARSDPGDLSIATGIYTGNKIPGRATLYSGLRVWSYP